MHALRLAWMASRGLTETPRWSARLSRLRSLGIWCRVSEIRCCTGEAPGWQGVTTGNTRTYPDYLKEEQRSQPRVEEGCLARKVVFDQPQRVASSRRSGRAVCSGVRGLM